MRLREAPGHEKLVLLRNLVRVGAFDPRLVVQANRLTRAAQVDYGAMQKRSEFAPFLALLLRARPRRVIEIGRGAGGSLWALCRAAADDATIVSVDLPEGPYGGHGADPETLSRYKAFASPGQSLHLIQGDSRAAETASAVRAVVDRADLLFIDGDHTFEGAKRDYETYLPAVRDGGLVVFHDILPHDDYPEIEVHRLWHELRGRKLELVSPAEVTAEGGRWGGIGVLVVPHGAQTS